jgi:hypothetical protein
MTMTETDTRLRKKKVSQGRLVTIKVSLRGAKPPIWRRLVMAASSPLAELHLAIQSSMGWGDCHLHVFEVGGRSYGDRSAMDYVTDERGMSLGGIAHAGVHRFSYIYDFGDNWEHVVTIEKVASADPPLPRPVCIAGKRACPPDDCGGIWGYYKLLEGLANPSHPQHADMKDWIDDDFDPEAFEVADANIRLGSYIG